MNDANIKQLENWITEAFKEKLTIAITDASLNENCYMTRIGVCGLPFEISAFEKTIDSSEQLALREFKKQLEDTVINMFSPSEQKELYKNYVLNNAELSKLYQYELGFKNNYIDEMKQKTQAETCRLSNGKYECMLSSPHMHLHVKGIANSRKAAVNIAILRAHTVFHPLPVYVGIKLNRN